MGMQGYRGLASLVVALLFAAVVFAVPHGAEASKPPTWSYSVLYNFSYCTAPCDVNVPSSGVTVAPHGSLLGTACGGGTENDGGVYQLSPGATQWKDKVLSDFAVHDPYCPTTANLLLSRSSTSSGPGMHGGKTVYYGTTPGDGGVSSCGTVFELSHTASGWHLTTIYSFQNNGDGCRPAAGLIEDARGHLDGTTSLPYGTVFELTNSGSGWTLDTLYTFSGDDGSRPTGNLLLDKGGNLYGTAQRGGSQGCGTVFQLSPAHTLNTLHDFCTLPDDADGSAPAGALIMDGAGELYGVTYGHEGVYPAGTVYKVSQGGSFETLYTFCSLADCADGANPFRTSLVMDKAGNLYGNTYFGGENNIGTVFELTSGGQEIVLHSFASGDGAYPAAPLTFDKSGNLLGTTSSGGGSVFKLKRH